MLIMFRLFCFGFMQTICHTRMSKRKENCYDTYSFYPTFTTYKRSCNQN